MNGEECDDLKNMYEPLQGPEVNQDSKKKVSYEEYIKFDISFHSVPTSMRFGQAFMYEFNIVGSNPKLFYEKIEGVAKKIIWEEYLITGGE